MIDTVLLRKKIFDLAISGKLTSQNLDAESAHKDFYDLEEIKSDLAKRKLIKNEIVASSENNEELFEIPKNWRWCQLADLCKSITDGTHKTPIYIENGVPFLSVKNVSSGCFDFEDIKYISEQEHYELIKRCQPEQGDILFCRIGTLGKAIEIDFEPFFSIFVSLGLIKPLDSFLSKYLVVVLNSGYGDKWIKNNKAGDSMHAAKINLDVLRSFMVPLPPKEEQVRIVEKISESLSQIDIIDTMQQQYSSDLEVLKSKIIDAGIQGKLTEQLPEDGTAGGLLEQIAEEKNQLIKEKKMKKERDLPAVDDKDKDMDIPQNWEWVRLGDISQIFGGKRIPAGRSLTTDDTGHKYIRVSEMKNRTVIIDSLMYVPEDIYPSISRYIINKEDVYITVAGTIGRVGTIPDEIDGANLTENADRVVFNHLNKNWLVACLASSFVQKQIAMVTTQVAQPKLSIKRIEELIIPLPPLLEQERIAEKIEKTLELL